MATDNLLSVIASLVKREGRIAKEESKKAKEAVKAAKEAEKEEEDEDEDPVGDGKSDAKAAEKEPAPKPKPDDEKEPEEKPEPEDDKKGEGDTKPTGPDPALVAQVARIVKQEIEDEKKDKKEKEIKLSGKKEKIDTKPTIKQEGKMKGRMTFKEAIAASVLGTDKIYEGYEGAVLNILYAEGIRGPLGYDPFFENGKLYVEKGSEKEAKQALKDDGSIRRIPKIVGEELAPEEYLQMEAVSVDGRLKGFKEALKRLTYEKIKAMKEKEESKAKKEEVEIEEKWKKGKYTIKDKNGKILGTYNSGGKAKKAMDDLMQKGDYDQLEVSLVEEVEIDEGTSLQVKMALSDVGLKGTWKNNKVYVKKKDVKKAEKALKGNVIYKGKTPEVVGEEAPANNVGDGNIDLTPHKKKKKVKTEEFSGSKVFIVSPETFWQARLGKSRYTRYEKYVGNDDIGEAIREYGRSNPKAPIILKNSQNGSMLYLKYGKRG